MGYTSMAKCKALTGSAVYIKGLMCTTCAIDSKCYCCCRCFRVSCCLFVCRPFVATKDEYFYQRMSAKG